MPQIVPTYACPVCENVRPQRGAVGRHLLTHTIQELEPHIANKQEIISTGAHPEIRVENTIYKLCITEGIGFEKGKNIDTKHECEHDYCTLFDEPEPEPVEEPVPELVVEPEPVVEQAPEPTVKKTRRRKAKVVEPVPEELNVITCMLEDDEITQKKCSCHIEISQLKQQLARQMSELVNAVRELREHIINPTVEANPKTKRNTKKDQNAILEPVPEPVLEEPKKKRAEPKASKKEQELGMWCTRCESCKMVAQFTKDLRPCGSCAKLSHYNEDLNSCYHWDCEICKKAVCLQCVKAAGANKLHPLCSSDCAKKFKAKRGI
jgi:hypothetical protein